MKPTSYILLIFLLLCLGCSPQRRLVRLLEHHPELTVADTVRFRDTVTIPSVQADTFINLTNMTDTVVVEKERLSVKLFRHRDTLYLKSECKADTIFRDRMIAVEKIKMIKPDTAEKLRWKLLPWLVLGASVLLLIKKAVKS